MGKKILVVDDDKKFLKIITDALIPRGLEIIPATNGEMGIHLFESQDPDLVILDALLPKLDGFQVCDAIRKKGRGKDIPIIMMTAIYKMPVKEREARNRYRVQEYLTKPIDLKNLVDLLAKHLDLEDVEPAKEC